MRFRKMVFFIIICFTLVIAGCSKVSKPDEVFKTYASHWAQGEFDAMYELISTDSKEYISRDEFTARYKNIYEGIEAHNISIEIDPEKKIQEEETQTKIPYTLKMETLAGPIAFSHEAILIKEEQENERGWLI